MANWLNMVKNAKKEAITEGNLKKIHYEIADGKEMVEEYNMDTGVLTRRAWRVKTDLGGQPFWDVEIGDPEPAGLKPNELIKESSSQPVISRRVTRINLEWRIRNLPYPIDVYSITADKDKKKLIVRTSNKKYYKELSVPELERADVLPEQENVSFTHKFNTLIITYKKPKEYIELEKAVFEELKKVPAKKSVNEMAGEMGDCRPS